MNATDGSADDLVNKGFVALRPDGESSHGARTFIVTGLERSGTTLLASMLRLVGIFMGSAINDIVHEDEEFAQLLEAGDRGGMQRLIAERNAAYGTWGFKQPMLCRWLSAQDMGLFHEPRVIVPFRDPVAISVRASLSEYQEPLQALQTAAADTAAITRFIAQLRCPTLLVSYEKALAFPDDMVDAFIGFCGLPHNQALRRQLIGAVQPNRPAYLLGARRRFEGRIEGVANGRLYGWCRLTGVTEPVALELFADGELLLRFAADVFRQDLRDAGYGEGRHGFFLDLAALRIAADAVVRVRVATHGMELDNSGRRLHEYRDD